MINFIIVHSQFETEQEINLRLSGYIEIVKSHKLTSTSQFVCDKPSNLSVAKWSEKPVVILVATGGTEQAVAEIIQNFTLPVLIIAPNQKNAVAASLEIYSVFKHKKNILLKYVNSPLQLDIVLNDFIDAANAIYKINKAKIGAIGSASEWLLTSKDIDSFGNFDTELKYIPTETLIDLVAETKDEDQTVKNFELKLSEYSKNDKVTKDEIIQSGKVYSSLKSICNNLGLQAVTIRCFDLLPYKYTACMGLSFLNDEGITGGCEGDLHATFSMMIANLITGDPAWMANPSSIDFDENCITVAHCSTPLKMLLPKTVELHTHMESDLSVAVSGKLQKIEVTVFRTGDNFDKMLAITGKIIASNMQDANLCRTQAIIKLDGDVSKWLDNSLGNHQVIVYGNILEKLKVFCKLSDIELIL
ncbi:MAG TPA: hypothetical protein PL041_07870 [Melioribacteraceae bacterium]|nr:hypothetical protein [Melioribacteraceae bacterium]